MAHKPCASALTLTIPGKHLLTIIQLRLDLYSPVHGYLSLASLSTPCYATIPAATPRFVAFTAEIYATSWPKAGETASRLGIDDCYNKVKTVKAWDHTQLRKRKIYPWIGANGKNHKIVHLNSFSWKYGAVFTISWCTLSHIQGIFKNIKLDLIFVKYEFYEQKF